MGWCLDQSKEILAELHEVRFDLKEARRNAEQFREEHLREQEAQRELLSRHATELANAACEHRTEIQGLSSEKEKIQGELIHCLKLLREQDEKFGLLRRDLADSEFEVDQLRIAFRCASDYSLQLETDKRHAESVVECICGELSHAAATATAVTEAAARAAAAAAEAAAVAASSCGSGRCSPGALSDSSGSSEADLAAAVGDASVTIPQVLAESGTCDDALGAHHHMHDHHERHRHTQEQQQEQQQHQKQQGKGGVVVAVLGEAADPGGAQRQSAEVSTGTNTSTGCGQGGECSTEGVQGIAEPTRTLSPCRDADAQSHRHHPPGDHPLTPAAAPASVALPVGPSSGCCVSLFDVQARPRRGRRRVDMTECRRNKGAMEVAFSQTEEAVASLEAAVAQLRAVCRELHRAVVNGVVATAPSVTATEVRAQANAAAAAATAAAAAALSGAAVGHLGASRPLYPCNSNSSSNSAVLEGSPPRPPATPPRAPAALMYFSNLVTPKARRTGGQAVSGCGGEAAHTGHSGAGCGGDGAGGGAHGMARGYPRGGNSQGASGASGGAGNGTRPLAVRVDDLLLRGCRHPTAASPSPSSVSSLPPTPTPQGLGLSESLLGWASHSSGSDVVRSATVVQGRPMTMGGGGGGGASPPSRVPSLLSSPARSSGSTIQGPSVDAPPPARSSAAAVGTGAAKPGYLPAFATASPHRSPGVTTGTTRGAPAWQGPGRESKDVSETGTAGGPKPPPSDATGASGQGVVGGGGLVKQETPLDMELVSLRLTNEALQRQVAELQRQNDLLQLRQLATTTTTTTTATTANSTPVAAAVSGQAGGQQTPLLTGGSLGGAFWGTAAPVLGAATGSGAMGGTAPQSRLLGAAGSVAPAAVAAATASPCSLPSAAAFYYGSLPPGRPQTGEALYSGPHHGVTAPSRVAGPTGGAGRAGPAPSSAESAGEGHSSGCRTAGAAVAAAALAPVSVRAGTTPAQPTHQPLGLPLSPVGRPEDDGTTPGASAGAAVQNTSKIADGRGHAAAGPGPGPGPGPTGQSHLQAPASAIPISSRASPAIPEASITASSTAERGSPAHACPPTDVVARTSEEQGPCHRPQTAAAPSPASALPAEHRAPGALEAPPAPEGLAPPLTPLLAQAAAIATPPPGVDAALWELELLVACSKGSGLSG